MPELAAYPVRVEAMRSERPVERAGAMHLTLFPIATEQQVVGVRKIETRAGLDLQQRRMVSSILRILRNFQGLLDYSERDSLTGLLNRKTFDESFMKASAPAVAPTGDDPQGRRADTAAGSYWLGVIDIDHFKRVNDSFGHLIGDEALLRLSRLMRGSLWLNDRLYCFGREQFVVLMGYRGDESAALAFER